MKPSFSLLGAAVLCLAATNCRALSLVASAGSFAPFESGQRSIFGVAPSAELGAAIPLDEGTARAFVDLNYVRDRGREADDPTFDTPDLRYTAVSVSIGLDGDLVTERDARFGMRCGFGWNTSLITFDGPDAHRESVPTFGAVLNLRPSLRFDGWSLWMKQRVRILSDATFQSSDRTLNLSGSEVQLGFEWSPSNARRGER
jgi:hypothetical protein